jgi:hypothetical protein
MNLHGLRRTLDEIKTGAAMILVTLPLLLVVAGGAEAREQQIPALLQVPRQVAVDRPELMIKRAEVLTERNGLHADVLSQKKRCSRVIAGSAEDVVCISERGELASKVARHIADSDAFNAAVLSATQRQIGELCNSLDEEMQEMHAADLKIVELEVDALGAMLHVPLGIWERSEEPPEDTLREARAHLRNIADITDRIDELSGKRAWTEQRRDWVLKHIYVASPSQEYDVISSDAAAHGQTDFSALKQMPKFPNCERDAEGTLYLPQY